MKCFAIENHAMDSRVTMDDSGIVQTLNARMGTGGGNVPMVLIIDHSRRHSYQPLDVVPTLEAHMGTGGGNVPLVLTSFEEK